MTDKEIQAEESTYARYTEFYRKWTLKIYDVEQFKTALDLIRIIIIQMYLRR